MHLGWAFLIAIGWIAATLLIYSISDRRRKKMKPHSSEGFARLGEMLYRILFTFVPAILFFAVNLPIRIGRLYGAGWGFFTFAAEVLLIPLIFIIKAMLMNPEKLARKARETLGEYEPYAENFYREYENHREFDGKAPFHYIWEQLRYLAGKQGNSYFFCPRFKRRAFIKAIVENNRDVLPPLTGWKYYEDKERGNGYDSMLLLELADGTTEKCGIDRDSLWIFLWICLKQLPKLLLSAVLGFFVRIGRLLNPVRWFKKK